jgi:two-component system sensor histidine kinase UhpB
MATLYYAAAEGLTNATKHSDADRVRVELRTGGDRVSVAVTDDGRGGVDQTGAGISGIRDRAQLLGGDVEVVEVPGGGTRFLAWVPLPAGQAGAAARPTSPSVGQ